MATHKDIAQHDRWLSLRARCVPRRQRAPPAPSIPASAATRLAITSRESAHGGWCALVWWRRGAPTAGAREIDADGPARPFLRSRCARARKRTRLPRSRVPGGWWPVRAANKSVCSRPHGVQAQQRRSGFGFIPTAARCPDALHICMLNAVATFQIYYYLKKNISDLLLLFQKNISDRLLLFQNKKTFQIYYFFFKKNISDLLK
jgi:hypothetical protein